MTMVNNDGVWQENEDGTWSESIPYPFFVGFGLRKAKCQCGRKFKNLEAYQDHYREEHTDGKKYNRTPTGLHEVKNETV